MKLIDKDNRDGDRNFEETFKNVCIEIIEAIESLPSSINVARVLNPGFSDCPNCGGVVGKIPDASYCSHCGYKVLDEPFSSSIILKGCANCKVAQFPPILFDNGLDFCCYCGKPLMSLSEGICEEIFEALPDEISSGNFLNEGVSANELFSNDLHKRIGRDIYYVCDDRT